MLSNHLILCCPLLLPSILPNISTSPSNWYSGLISFRIDWFDLLQSKELSRVFSSTVSKYQFFSAQASLWSNCHILHSSWKNHSFNYVGLCWQSDMSAFKLYFVFNWRIIIILLWFLPHINMNQPYIYIYSLFLKLPSLLPPHFICLGCLGLS